MSEGPNLLMSDERPSFLQPCILQAALLQLSSAAAGTMVLYNSLQ